MKVRILQLKNNFYRDERLPKEYKRKRPLGAFCVLGYFDALEIRTPIKGQDQKIWDLLSKVSINQLDGSANLRTLVCLTSDAQKDSDFWKRNATEPFYFISMIRVDKKKVSADNILNNIDNLNKNSKNLIAYLAYDHSEVIIVNKTKRYSEGVHKVTEFRENYKAFKMYTIFSIREDFLGSKKGIADKMEDEKVCCRLRAIVKDFGLADAFFDRLQKILEKKNGMPIAMRRYDTLGSGDVLVEISNVSLCSILECYAMGKILTHTNIAYEDAFFNIESEILIKRG